MYDVVVIGQGLTGMLAAIWARKQGKTVALIAKGEGKLLQATGLLDGFPGERSDIAKLIEEYNLQTEISCIEESVNAFKQLTNSLGYPYKGDIKSPVEVITAAGHLKASVLYPETITPIPKEGKVIIVGFKELADYQPKYIKDNLQKHRPKLKIEAINVNLDEFPLRNLSQLDIARLLEKQQVRARIIKQIKEDFIAQEIEQPDLIIVPAILGVKGWQEVLADFTRECNSPITEAVGLPPNATAIRLHELLMQELIKLGVRLYRDTLVNGCELNNNLIKHLVIKNKGRDALVEGRNYILATGGILGGGLLSTKAGLEDTALKLRVNQYGEYLNKPENVYLVGASQGTRVTRYGITGGIYSIFSSYQSIVDIDEEKGGTQAC